MRARAWNSGAPGERGTNGAERARGAVHEKDRRGTAARGRRRRRRYPRDVTELRGEGESSDGANQRGKEEKRERIGSNIRSWRRKARRGESSEDESALELGGAQRRGGSSRPRVASRRDSSSSSAERRRLFSSNAPEANFRELSRSNSSRSLANGARSATSESEWSSSSSMYSHLNSRRNRNGRDWGSGKRVLTNSSSSSERGGKTTTRPYKAAHILSPQRRAKRTRATGPSFCKSPSSSSELRSPRASAANREQVRTSHQSRAPSLSTVQQTLQTTTQGGSHADGGDSRSIFVWQLAQKARENDVRNFFSQVGAIRSVQLIADRRGHHRGAGYVEFEDEQSVGAAVKLSGEPLLGVPVAVRPSNATSAPKRTSTSALPAWYASSLNMVRRGVASNQAATQRFHDTSANVAHHAEPSTSAAGDCNESSREPTAQAEMDVGDTAMGTELVMRGESDVVAGACPEKCVDGVPESKHTDERSQGLQSLSSSAHGAFLSEVQKPKDNSNNEHNRAQSAEPPKYEVALSGMPITPAPPTAQVLQRDPAEIAREALAKLEKKLPQPNSLVVAEKHPTRPPGTATHEVNAASTEINIGPKNKVEPFTKLYFGNVVYSVTDDDLRAIFSPFGEIRRLQLQRFADSGRSRGFGFLEYATHDSAVAALEQLNGLDVAGRQLRVGLASAEPSHRGGNFVASATLAASSLASRDIGGHELKRASGSINFDGGPSFGVKFNATERAKLMQRLSRGEVLSGTENGNDDTYNAALTTIDTPSRALLLRNMFDPRAEAGEDYHSEIMEDVRDECTERFGALQHIYVDKNSAGLVYLRFEALDAATRARESLNGRWFDGMQVRAAFIDDGVYAQRFGSG